MTGLAAMRTQCPACGAALTQHERFAGGFCSDWQCRRRRVDAQRKRELMQAIEEQRAAAASSVGFPAGREAPVVLLHWFDTPLVPVPQEQREKLRAHLLALQPEVQALVAQARTAEAGVNSESANGAPPDATVPEDEDEDEDEAVAARAESPEAAVASLQSQVCARCTGYCCRPGNGQHAFIDAELLSRLQLERPQASHEELVQDYLDHIPKLHRADSCAFHGAHGCALPRARRSDVCNSYLCNPLEQATKRMREPAARRFFVVRNDSGHGPEGAFVPPF